MLFRRVGQEFNMRHHLVPTAVVLLALASPALATVPATVTAEALLSSTGGGPVADGNYAVTFALYKDAQGGAPVWTEGPVQVVVKGGALSQSLGTTKPLNAAAVAAAPWLSLQVGADPELARKPLRSVPFALRAEVAETVDCSGCVTAGMLDPGVLAGYAKTAQLANVAQSGAYADLAGAPKLGVSCGSGLVVKGLKADGSLECVAPVIAGGKCQPGQMVTEVKPDGSVLCSAMASGGSGALNNTFTMTASAIGLPLGIPDNTGKEAVVALQHAEQGPVKGLTLQVALSNSDLSKVRVALLPPDDKVKGLVLCDPCGGANEKAFDKTYTAASALASGSLAGYVGKSLAGVWTLKVLDSSYCVPQLAGNAALCSAASQTDGSVLKFSVGGEVESKQAAATSGTFAPGVFAGPPYQCTGQWAGQVYYDSGLGGLRTCDGSVWRSLTGSCGNGILEPGEECDDGNLVPGDGCLGSCVVASQTCDQTCVAAGTAALEPATFTKLLPAKGATGDQFGRAVSVSGTRAMVGVPYDDAKGTDSGSVVCWELQPGGQWQQTAKLLPPDGQDATEVQFGRAVALAGERVVVGAPGTSPNKEGRAYVYDRATDGSWQQVAMLSPSDISWSNAAFGWAVGLAGDRAVVGQTGPGSEGGKPGSAYVFERQADGNWKQAAKFVPSDLTTNSQFGISVAIAGKTVVVGNPGDEPNHKGSAYVYERQLDGSWKSTAKLVAWDAVCSDNCACGRAVAATPDLVVLGCPERSDNSGGAYVFARHADGTWKPSTVLLAPDGAKNDRFGGALSENGGRVLVGAPTSNAGYGSAYVFGALPSGKWTVLSKLLTPSGGASNFGTALTISGPYVVAGGPFESSQGQNWGAAWLFKLAAGCTSQSHCICKPGYAGADCGSKL
jgi:cysteine-rich repeat protein